MKRKREVLNKAVEAKHDIGQEIIKAFLSMSHADPENRKLADDYLLSERKVKAAIRGLREDVYHERRL